MVIADFSGGKSSRLSPNLIGLNEATICENVDLTAGTLKPLKGNKATNNTISLDTPNFTYFKGNYIARGSGSTFVEFNDSLYIADAVNTIVKTTDGINFYELGLNSPSSILSGTSSFSVTFSLSESSGGDVVFTADTYDYLVQYKTTAGAISYEEKSITVSTGATSITLNISSMTNLDEVSLYRKYESKYRFIGSTKTIPSIVDSIFDISTNSITTPYEELLGSRQYVYTYYSSITNIESAPSGYSDDINLDTNEVTITGFVPSSDGTVDMIRLYRLGGTLTNLYLVAEIPVNSTSYLDVLSDIDVLNNDTPLETQGFIKPKDGLRFLTEYNAALFATVDSTLYFSNPGLVDNWTEFNYIVFPEHITGLGATQNGLLIFSRNKTWILTGSDLTTYSKFLLNGSQGCITHSTIAYVDNYLLWQSLDGICSSTGSNIELISWPKLGKVSVNPITAEVYESQYFLFHTDGVIVVDFRAGVKFFTLDLIIRGAYYNPTFDKLYILKSGDIGMYEYNTSNTLLDYTYRTGWLSDNGITNYKTYKDIYIQSKGSGEIDLYLDGNLVVTRQVVDGFNTIRYPQGDTKGYYAEFELRGSNEIIEIYFITEGRQNGK